MELNLQDTSTVTESKSRISMRCAVCIPAIQRIRADYLHMACKDSCCKLESAIKRCCLMPCTPQAKDLLHQLPPSAVFTDRYTRDLLQ